VIFRGNSAAHFLHFSNFIMFFTVFAVLLLAHCIDCTNVPEAALKFESYEIVTDVATDEVRVDIDTQRPLNCVENEFISFNIDSQQFSLGDHKINFSSVRLHTLMRGLSPALLRVGGSPADWLFFDKPLKKLKAAHLKPDATVATKEDIKNLVQLTLSTGNRLLFDLNLQLRFGQQWNPSNAIELFEFCNKNGFGENIDWELGNEPDADVSSHGQMVLDPRVIGNDFMILHRVIRSYPIFNHSRIVGPDVVGISPGSYGLKILQAVSNSSGSFLRALTFHHYYFNGEFATYKDYIDPKHLSNLGYIIDLAKSAVSRSTHPKTPLWIGETSDSWHSGTKGVSDRYVSGFLWLDKLGISAQKGIGVVMRQTLYYYNYALLDDNMYPNPDYWLCALHRSLVGQTVLGISLSKAPITTRVYAHCTSTRLYEAGAVTVFGLNLSPNTTSELSFDGSALGNQPIDVYMLTPSDGTLLSKFVTLNGKQRLEMPSETEMPQFKPDHLPAGSKVSLLPLTFGFVVFPKANVQICKS